VAWRTSEQAGHQTRIRSIPGLDFRRAGDQAHEGKASDEAESTKVHRLRDGLYTECNELEEGFTTMAEITLSIK
jgi:hypothetical protein